MKAFLFPGQGSQFVGMGQDDCTSSAQAAKIYDTANEILGYSLSNVMFTGSEDDLKETRITQPAIFLHAYVRMKLLGDKFKPDAVAGHSLGEFTALAAAGALSFKDALLLVRERAEAM
jgi:[acyl-carrier-protein] S-malonyltransferase